MIGGSFKCVAVIILDEIISTLFRYLNAQGLRWMPVPAMDDLCEVFQAGAVTSDQPLPV